ncbi:MAG TPA: hypothetical protein VFD27_11255 [Chthoniobacteraceae bacterium]|jgi:hypothetical protein|nr:hypothetical protein [Chthoniobacteraceae bacterium]
MIENSDGDATEALVSPPLVTMKTSPRMSSARAELATKMESNIAFIACNSDARSSYEAQRVSIAKPAR